MDFISSHSFKKLGNKQLGLKVYSWEIFLSVKIDWKVIYIMSSTK